MKRPNNGNRENCKLIDGCGKLVVRLTLSEALKLEDRGKCKRVGPGTWQQHMQPSNADESDCSLTVQDTKRVTDHLSGGTPLTPVEWERYAGWGLISAQLSQMTCAHA